MVWPYILYYIMDASQKYYAKPDTKDIILYDFIYMEFPEL